MKIKTYLNWFWLLLILAALTALTLYFIRPTAYTKPVTRGKAIDAVFGTLRVEESYRMQLRSDNGGRVIRTNMEIGQSLKKGEIILKLDTEEIKLQIEAVELGKAAQEAKLALGSSLKYAITNQEESLADLEGLDDQGSVSPRKLQREKRRLEELREQRKRQKINDETTLGKLENNLKKLRLELEQMTVKSPIDGTIVAVLAHEGDLIGPGSVIAQAISNERRVLASISEEDFSKVKEGQAAVVRLLGYGKKVFNGHVIQLLPTTDPQTQRYSVFLDLEIDPEKLTPGLTGEVSIVIAERENTLIIPNQALLGDKVLVVKEGRVETRKVKKGYQSLNLVEILDGLEEGELVILENQDLFQRGDRVKLEK